MTLSLKGKVVLVTASSKGIGLGVARVCASHGAKLAICSSNSANLKAATKLIIEESGAEVLPVTADISVKKDALKIVRQTLTHFDGVDVLVHNAGPPRSGSIMDLNDSDWESAIRMLLLSPIWFTKAILPSMIRKKTGTADLPYISQPQRTNTKSTALQYGAYRSCGSGKIVGHRVRSKRSYCKRGNAWLH